MNSFWLSGCGQLPAGENWSTGQHDVQLITTLRQPLLADDMMAWLQAWKKLDALRVARPWPTWMAGSRFC